MKQGILIFAHNNGDLDYVLMAAISGKLANKHLKKPVTLVTDNDSLSSTSYNGELSDIFEYIILVDRPDVNNVRHLRDGTDSSMMPFINSNRATAWYLTPYDRTLLIDTDFLIFSDHLNNYWGVDDLLINSSINDISTTDRLGYTDYYVSETSVPLLWATTVMFTKNKESKLFFDLVTYVGENYQSYRDLYRFDSKLYRNDISFTIAYHILHGHNIDNVRLLPPVLTAVDKDILCDVSDAGKLTLLISSIDSKFTATTINNIDIHIMNKKSILRQSTALLRIAE